MATLTEFYGDDAWEKVTFGGDLMKIYKNKISNFKKFVYDIPVYQSGNKIGYHLIMASKSKGAANIRIRQQNNES